MTFAVTGVQYGAAELGINAHEDAISQAHRPQPDIDGLRCVQARHLLACGLHRL